MATLFESVVTVHVEPGDGISRDDVLSRLRARLTDGQFLVRATTADAITVTAQQTAQDRATALEQAERQVAQALDSSGARAVAEIHHSEVDDERPGSTR